MDDLVHSGASASVPGECLSVSEGQWVVVRGSFSDEIGQVTKVSEKQVRTGRHGGRESYHRPADVLFAGTEKEARDLLSVLTGINRRNDRARQQLADQRRASRDAAIAKARTAAASNSMGMSEANEPNNPTPEQGE